MLSRIAGVVLDPSKYRVNIGIRTLTAPDIQFGVYSNDRQRAFVTQIAKPIR